MVRVMLEAMRLPCFWFLAIFAFTSVFAAAQNAPQALMPGQLVLTPAVVVAGAPELIRVHAPAGTQSVSGEWLEKSFAFFEKDGEWFALGGVDVEAPPGASTLHVTAHTTGGVVDLSRAVEIEAAHYRTGSLTVAPRFVSPGAAELERIHAEIALKQKIFAASADHPLWHGNFVAPVKAQATDSFGTRRMFNGKLASIHKGADFRAAMGTVVRASNSGVVVLARPLYFEGNCVILDHGMGLFTESMHFSRIDVKEGQQVKAGDVLGLSGATGRVTGPHLHWAVRWQGAMLDPIKLLHLDLNAIP